MAGYGAYWVVLEKIAAQYRPECASTSLALTWRNWARHLRSSTQQAQVWIRAMAAAKLVVLEEGDLGAKGGLDPLLPLKNVEETGLPRGAPPGGPDGGYRRHRRSATPIARVCIPNLPKYADEYNKKVGIKSRQDPDKLPSESGFLSLPALPATKDLAAGATAGPLEGAAAAPEPTLTAAPSGGPYEGKDRCTEPGCTKRGTTKDTMGDGKWKCSRHGPDAPPPTPGNGAGKGENRTPIPPIIRALNLTPEKSEAVAPLYQRHLSRPIPNDDLATQLLGAGLDANEVFRTAQAFFGSPGKH